MELGDDALDRVAGPTGVVKSTAIASLAAASAVMRCALDSGTSQRGTRVNVTWIEQRAVRRKYRAKTSNKTPFPAAKHELAPLLGAAKASQEGWTGRSRVRQRGTSHI